MKLRRFLAILILALAFAVPAFATDTDVLAIAITWQNGSGYWFAVGPIQSTSVGCRSEEEALSYVMLEDDLGGLDIGDPDNYSSDYTYRVYDLGRCYESYDLDVHAYAARRLSFYIEAETE